MKSFSSYSSAVIPTTQLVGGRMWKAWSSSSRTHPRILQVGPIQQQGRNKNSGTDKANASFLILDRDLNVWGDGLLGGIWKPYEHSCAMTDQVRSRQFLIVNMLLLLLLLLLQAGKKVYKSLNTDYPSVSSLRLLKGVVQCSFQELLENVLSFLRHELRQSKKFVIFGTGAQVTAAFSHTHVWSYGLLFLTPCGWD